MYIMDVKYKLHYDKPAVDEDRFWAWYHNVLNVLSRDHSGAIITNLTLVNKVDLKTLYCVITCQSSNLTLL